MLRIVLAAVWIQLFTFGMSFAAHPLITDDAGTQGKGKTQVEFDFEHAYDEEGGESETSNEFQLILTHGVSDTVDIVLCVPLLYTISKAPGERISATGLSDVSLEVKWRFFEKDGLSLAVKPGLSFPTGDDSKGLGAGEVGGSIFGIATMELEPWAFHFNAGYLRNENSIEVNERTDIWHVSLAAQVKALSWLTAVANVGAERSPERGEDTPAAFILGGLIFSLTENVDLDVGIKGGLTETEDDYAVLSGLTLRF